MPVDTIMEHDIVDGFTYSMSLALLPTSYRAHCLAQMETLRRAKGYTARWYTAPNNNDEPISNFSQAKYQINITPGSYLWGISAWFAGDHDGDIVHILITDACSETQLSSDYELASLFLTGKTTIRAAPALLPQPRLISEPGLVNIEVYLGAVATGSSESVQILLFTAEPCSALLRVN